MIARHETHGRDEPDLWSKISAPLPPGSIQWRQDGRPTQRDGKYIARFVPYIDAQFVQQRLDEVVPGEWDSKLEPLPLAPASTGDGEALEQFAFKCQLQILGVIREDVGSGDNYKQAATDAFKRAAVRFGVGRELYSMGQLWVQMDGDGKYAKPIEDPGTAYLRKLNRTGGVAQTAATPPKSSDSANGSSSSSTTSRPAAPSSSRSGTPATTPSASSSDAGAHCPKCGGAMWDNRTTKTNPRAPDFKCRDRDCDGVIWPPKDGKPAASSAKPGREGTSGPVEDPSRAPASPRLEYGTLEWARALPLMGGTSSWGGNGQKPIGSLPRSVLKQAGHFFRTKIDEEGDAARPAMKDQLLACRMVVADIDANSPQKALELEPAATAPHEPVEEFPAALRDEDDDLPF